MRSFHNRLNDCITRTVIGICVTLIIAFVSTSTLNTPSVHRGIVRFRDQAATDVQTNVLFGDDAISSIAVIVSGLEERENVLFPALKSLSEHVVSPLRKLSQHVYVAFCSSVSDSTRRELGTYAKIDDFFELDAKNQFDRLEKCFQSVLEKKGDVFSYFIKTRPDIIWLGNIRFPFDGDAIMLRSRRIGRARITSQHVSWPKDACSCSTGCVMVDDQVAVVPRCWQNAYFRLRDGDGTMNKSSGSESNHANNKQEGRKVRLEKRTVMSSCPCVTEKGFWPEGKLTLRLATHSAMVAVSPFDFVLAPPLPGKSKWREIGTPFQKGDDWRWCDGADN